MKMRMKLHYEIGESDKIVLLQKKNKECILWLEVVYSNYLALQALDCAFYLVITR